MVKTDDKCWYSRLLHHFCSIMRNISLHGDPDNISIISLHLFRCRRISIPNIFFHFLLPSSHICILGSLRVTFTYFAAKVLFCFIYTSIGLLSKNIFIFLLIDYLQLYFFNCINHNKQYTSFFNPNRCKSTKRPLRSA